MQKNPNQLPAAAGLLEPVQERGAPQVADERAERDPEQERSEPPESAASRPPPPPHHLGPDAERLPQAGSVPGLRERRESVTAKRQGERDHREVLGRRLPPLTKPEPPAAAGEHDSEGARSG